VPEPTSTRVDLTDWEDGDWWAKQLGSPLEAA
jgi:hypothetical protein